MSNRFFTILAAAMVAALFTAGSALARTTRMNVAFKAQLANGTVLKPGKYRVNIVRAPKMTEAKIYKWGKLIAKVPVKIQNETKKNHLSEVYYNKEHNAEVLTEVRPGGWRENIIFPKKAQRPS